MCVRVFVCVLCAGAVPRTGSFPTLMSCFFDDHKDSERQARLPTYDLEHFEMKTAPIGISFDVVAKYGLHTDTCLWDQK